MRRLLTAYASGDSQRWPADTRDDLFYIAKEQGQVLLEAVVQAVAAPALEYFHRVIKGEHGGDPAEMDGAGILISQMKVYELARTMSPLSTRLLQPSWEDTHDLMVTTKASVYFTGPETQGMQDEWADYLEMTAQLGVGADDESPNEKMRRALLFWAAARQKLPNIAKLARYCFIISSSSAAAERVFSVLKASQSLVQMHKALEDYTEVMVQRQYNHRN